VSVKVSESVSVTPSIVDDANLFSPGDKLSSVCILKRHSIRKMTHLKCDVTDKAGKGLS
jgi:hypothetical protein